MPTSRLAAASLKMAERIVNAPVAIRNIKKSRREGLDLPIDEAIALEIGFAHCFSTEDKRKVCKILEKRKENRSEPIKLFETA